MKRAVFQHDLFENMNERDALENAANRRDAWDKYLLSFEERHDPMITKLGIVRGFLGVTYKIDPVQVMERPLVYLGGLTLTEMCEKNWKMVCAWMKEIQMYPGEKQSYLLGHLPCK